MIDHKIRVIVLATGEAHDFDLKDQAIAFTEALGKDAKVEVNSLYPDGTVTEFNLTDYHKSRAYLSSIGMADE